MKNRILRFFEKPEGVFHGSVFYQFSGGVGPSSIACDSAGSIYIGHYDVKGIYTQFLFQYDVIISICAFQILGLMAVFLCSPKRANYYRLFRLRMHLKSLVLHIGMHAIVCLLLCMLSFSPHELFCILTDTVTIHSTLLKAPLGLSTNWRFDNFLIMFLRYVTFCVRNTKLS